MGARARSGTTCRSLLRHLVRVQARLRAAGAWLVRHSVYFRVCLCVSSQIWRISCRLRASDMAHTSHLKHSNNLGRLRPESDARPSWGDAAPGRHTASLCSTRLICLITCFDSLQGQFFRVAAHAVSTFGVESAVTGHMVLRSGLLCYGATLSSHRQPLSALAHGMLSTMAENSLLTMAACIYAIAQQRCGCGRLGRGMT